MKGYMGMKKYYYVTKSKSKKINIPFTPLFNFEMRDRYRILNDVFGNVIEPENEKTCMTIVDAIKNNDPDKWEEAADLVLLSGVNNASLWVSHFLRIATGIRNPSHVKVPSSVLFRREDPVVKFKRVLKGYT